MASASRILSFLFFLQLLYHPETSTAQKTVIFEKIGTSRRFLYKPDDPIKLRLSFPDTVLKGRIWSIADLSFSVTGMRPFDIKPRDIRYLYRTNKFPLHLGKYLGWASLIFFGIIVTDHLLNNEQVLTPDLFIISGSIAGAGLITLSFSQSRYKMGTKWKVKILGMNIR